MKTCGSLLACPYSQPAFLLVEDVPADRFPEYFLVSESIEIVVSDLECQAQVVAIVIQAFAVFFRGSGNQCPHLGGAGYEDAGLEAYHLNIFLHPHGLGT